MGLASNMIFNLAWLLEINHSDWKSFVLKKQSGYGEVSSHQIDWCSEIVAQKVY